MKKLLFVIAALFSVAVARSQSDDLSLSQWNNVALAPAQNTADTTGWVSIKDFPNVSYTFSAQDSINAVFKPQYSEHFVPNAVTTINLATIAAASADTIDNSSAGAPAQCGRILRGFGLTTDLTVGFPYIRFVIVYPNAAKFSAATSTPVLRLRRVK